MRHYEQAEKLIGSLKKLVRRHPVNEETALLWFEASHEILEVAHAIRREAWDKLPAIEREKLMLADPKLNALRKEQPAA